MPSPQLAQTCGEFGAGMRQVRREHAAGPRTDAVRGPGVLHGHAVAWPVTP
ncbi:hypothetical protein ACWDV4_17840 [Micromonospora sp. NPDC003197]